MIRINTNIASLAARHRMSDGVADIQRTTERLSTGLRINRGRDDPAGLIASETLRSETVAINAAIENSQRTNHFIATVEGALAEMSSLLLDLRQLTVETANRGALSRAEIQANQLQADAIVEAIDRIAQTTTVADRRVLDGSLAYTLSGVSAAAIPIRDVRVMHAGLAGVTRLPVVIEIQTEGAQAEQSWTPRRSFYDATVDSTSSIEVTGDVGSRTVTLTQDDLSQAAIISAVNNETEWTGIEAGSDSPTEIDFNSQNYGPEANMTLRIDERAGAYWAQSDSFLTTVEGEWLLRVSSNNGAQILSFDGPQAPNAVVAAVNAVSGSTGLTAIYRNNEFSFLSTVEGAAAVASVAVQPRVYFTGSDSTDANEVNGTPGLPARLDWNSYADFLTAAVAGTSRLEITGNDGTRTISLGTGVYNETDIVNAVNAETANTGVSAGFAAGTITFESVGVGPGAFVRVRGMERPETQWTDQTDFINQAATALNTLEIQGSKGSRTLDFDTAVFTPDDIVNAVNGVTGDTGVTASRAGATITFASEAFGPSETVWVRAMHPIPALTTPIDHAEATGRTTDVTVTGSDGAVEIASINGDPRTVSDGLHASLRSLDLSIDIEFDDFVGMSVGEKGGEGIYSVFTEFYVTGGGANFQIAGGTAGAGRIHAGLPSLGAADLGDTSVGFLSDITRGGTASLAGGATEDASEIIDAAIAQVAQMRGELGMIQKDVLEPNISSQRVALENTVGAESTIRDADVAAEVGELTRARIISQALTRVLDIARTQPTIALQLLS